MSTINDQHLKLATYIKPSVVLIVSALYAGMTQAQNLAEEDIPTLDTIVVTATKTEQSIDKVTASVQVVTEDDISKMGSATLKDVINKTPGLNIQYGTFPSGSAVSKSSINMRGMGATGTLWLIDGRRMAGEVNNPYDLDRIPASMIERIEIVKGPMSALYGADALGGVINIITKRPENGLTSQVSISAGSNKDGDGGNQQLSASIQGNAGKFYGSLYASTLRSDPYSEKEKTNTFVGSGRHQPQGGIPKMPGFLNPKSPTGGKPFYLQPDGSIKPKPLDPSKLNDDINAVKNDFNRFKSQAGNIHNHYDVPVSYREDATVDTIGGRFEYDVTSDLTLGAEFNWFKEEREGQYRSNFHPMAYMPPMGTSANPIVGHDASGKPISKRMGAIPAFDVPVNSYDDNERLDIGVDATYNINADADISFRVYNSDYEKRNRTTMSQYKDFGFPNEDKSASSGMNANVDITSYEVSGNWHLNDQHLLTGGVEYRDEEREATVFSQSADFDTRKVSYVSAYLQDDMRFNDSLGVTLGARYDNYHQDAYTNEFGLKVDDYDDNQTTFRIGAVKNFNDAFNIRANVAQGYRVPNIRELFIQKRTPAGMQLGAQTIDPRFDKQSYDLKPESTTSAELAVFGKQNKVDYGVTAFYNDIDDRISQVTKQSTTGGSYYTFENISNAKTYGAEMNVGYQLNDNVKTTLNWTELRTENNETGKDLEFNPERMITAGLDVQVSPKINVNTSIKHVGKQSYLERGKWEETDSYTMMNVGGGYNFGKDNNTYVYAGIDNLFDADVDKKIGSDVGTYYYAGLKYEF